VVDYEYLSLL
jgi:hypothetical protein